MTTYGNYFTSNSGNCRINTAGHDYADSDPTIVSNSNVEIICDATENVNNNVTTYSNGYDITYTLTKNGNWFVAYYNFPENKNTLGAITGALSVFNFAGSAGGASSKYYLEPTKLDDADHGIPPYSSYPNNIFTRRGITFKGTTNTKGYRRSKIHYKPYVEYNKDTYDNGTVGTYASTTTVSEVSQYDAFQTFYNQEDPYIVLGISIKNVDDAKSTSPKFCTLTNSTSTAKISHSYSYSPYVNTAAWNLNQYLSFTYNTLPTYPKELVLTYGSNWDSLSYDGDSINIEAKAWYNSSYDRFTTTTPDDEGFTSYKRYVDVTYSAVVINSSSKPSGITGYTSRIWQSGSRLGIAYNWSVDGNPSWVHLSSTTGNTTKVTVDPIVITKPTVGGKLKLNIDTEVPNGTASYGTISGNTWENATSAAGRTCVIRQNMKISNCCAQNITPKDSSGQPYRSLILRQKTMSYNDARFSMKWQVSFVGKDTTTYADTTTSVRYPMIKIGNISSTSNALRYTYWDNNATSKDVSIIMRNYPQPVVAPSHSGKIDVRTTINTNYQDDNGDAFDISYTGGTVDFTLIPNITFNKGYKSGISKRTWKLTNISNDNLEDQNGTVGLFDTTYITMPAIPISDITYSTAKSYWVIDDLYDVITTDNKDSYFTWSNSLEAKKFSITIPPNLPTIGEWHAKWSYTYNPYNIAEKYNVYMFSFSSTTENAIMRRFGMEFFSDKNTSINYSDSNFFSDDLEQADTLIKGTITLKLNNCLVCNNEVCFAGNEVDVPYPIDDKIVSSYYIDKNNISLPKPYQCSVLSAGNLYVKYTSPTSGNVSSDGGTVKFDWYGSPTKESASGHTQEWSVSAYSDIVSRDPAEGNPFIKGKVAPLAPDYKYQYNFNNEGWEDFSTTTGVATVTKTISKQFSLGMIIRPELTVNTYTYVNEGIYNYTPGKVIYYAVSSRNYTTQIRVYDVNSQKSYLGTSATITQDGIPGTTDIEEGNFSLKCDNDYNCNVAFDNGSTTMTVTGTESQNNIGAFTVTPVDPANGIDPGGNDSSKHITNYASNIREILQLLPSISASLIGEDKTYSVGESISSQYGINSSSPDNYNTTRKYIGSVTWDYEYKFSIKGSYDNIWYFSTKTGSGKYTKPNSLPVYYYRYVRWNDGSWTRLTSSQSLRTATSTGTYKVEICWATAPSTCGTGANGYKSHTMTIKQDTQKIETEYDYKVVVSISVTSGSVVTHTAFDTGNFSSTVSATAEGQARSRTKTTTSSGTVTYGTWSSWAKQVDLTPTIKYSGTVSGTGSTATGAYNVISQGASGSNYTSGTVTFVASATWANAGGQDRTGNASTSATWRRYGVTNSETLSLSLNDSATKTITAFDTQTWAVSVTASSKITKTSNGATQTSSSTPTVKYTGSVSGTGTSCTLTAVQGSNGNTTGSASVTFTATGSTGITKSVTATLLCYGKTYYNA